MTESTKQLRRQQRKLVFKWVGLYFSKEHIPNLTTLRLEPLIIRYQHSSFPDHPPWIGFYMDSTMVDGCVLTTLGPGEGASLQQSGHETMFWKAKHYHNDTWRYHVAAEIYKRLGLEEEDE